MKTVLIFVLSSANDHYPKLTLASLDTWESASVDGVTTYFYSDPTPIRNPKVISFPVGKGIYQEGKQDLLAFEWALKQLPWDYMARVNASCYVRKSKLIEYVQSLPEKRCFRGVIGKKEDGTEYLWGGSQLIMSRDVIDGMVAQRGHWNHSEMEDVSLSLMAKCLGVPLDGLGRAVVISKNRNWHGVFYCDGQQGAFDFESFQELENKATYHHFFRVRQFPENPAMSIHIMREMKKANLC